MSFIPEVNRACFGNLPLLDHGLCRRIVADICPQKILIERFQLLGIKLACLTRDRCSFLSGTLFIGLLGWL